MRKSKSPSSKLRSIGIGLLILSFLMWIPTIAAPLLPVSVGQKAAIAGTCFVVGEVMFWSGVALVGKDVADRYRDKINPRSLWRKIRRRRDRRKAPSIPHE